ncbi:MAG: ATP-binding cassette domain-containing protein, partial [Burkholderiales bacterium]|nr:ATP-binding cassette domain-containing protein [Burkholderiales bacterium]
MRYAPRRCPGHCGRRDIHGSCQYTHVALLGRTGAGKSTALLSLLRTLSVERGDILSDGINIQT